MKLSWNLTHIYINIQAWEDDCSKFKKFVSDYNIQDNFNTDLHDNLVFLEEGFKKLNKIYNYAILNYDTNIGNPDFGKLMVKADQLYTDFENEILPFQEWLNENNDVILETIHQEKKLRKYKNYFVVNKEESNSEYVEVENNLNIDMASNELLYSTNYISKFNYNGKEVLVTTDNHLPLLESKNITLRKRTYYSVLESLREKKDYASFLLNAHNKLRNMEAQKNGFNNSFEYNLRSKITLESYNKCKEIMNSNLDLFHRLIEVRRKALSLDSFSYYDMYPLVEEDYRIEPHEAKQIIIAALSPLGEKYIKLVNQIFDENWIDWLPYQGKRTGGYSLSIYDVHPYILINWQYNLDSLYMLVHEIGGAIASYLSSAEQSFIYAEQPIFIVETASFVNESLLSNYLIKHAKSDKDKNTYLHKQIDKLRENLFNSFQLVELEEELSKISKEERLTAEVISDCYEKILQKYYVNDKFQGIDLNKYNWIRITHLYKNLYNLDYLIASSIAQYIVHNLITEPTFSSLYLNMFIYGTNENILEILKKINVSLDLDYYIKHPIQEFRILLEQLEADACVK